MNEQFPREMKRTHDPDRLEKECLLQSRPNPHMNDVKSKEYIFISYAHDDAREMLEILDILDKNNYAYWFDRGIKTGEEWEAVVSSHIKNSCQFLLLLSSNSQMSKHVRAEIRVANDNDIPLAIVYIDDFQFADGVDIMVNRAQGIKRYLFSDQFDFEHRLCSDLMIQAKIDHERIMAENNKKFDSIKSHLLSGYEIIREVSDKQTRKTFMGRNKTTKLPVFIKQYIASDGSSENRLLFENEKHVLTTCLCQGIPFLLDTYEDSTSGGFLVENYIHGQSLNECGEFSQIEVLRIASQLARSLNCLHSNNIVHCDLKPENIMISSYGEAYLIDFNASQTKFKHSALWSRGTAGYAAPEQYQKNYRPDFRTDFYSLGKTIQAALSGFSNHVTDDETIITSAATTTLYGLFSATNNSTLPPNTHPQVRKLIDHLTAANPNDRPQSCDAVIAEIDKCRLILEFEEHFA